jgi:endo-1,4-beta-xylanase
MARATATARRAICASVGLLALLAAPARSLTLADCLAPGADCSLRQAAELAGVHIGAAVQPRLFESDPLYVPTLVQEFDSVTAENAHKWPQLHPEQGVYDFVDGDAVVDLAEANGMRVRGHTLLWANPTRIPDYVNSMSSPEALRAELAEHIGTVVGRYAGRIESWDVVNEPLENLGTTLYDNVFHQHLGPDYIAEAFRMAHAADPTARLFLNEIFVTVPGSERFGAFYDLVEGLLDDGVPIHGIGLQTHLLGNLVDRDPSEFQAAVQAFADLGLRVEITEMDVPMIAGEDRLADQAEIVFEIVGACLAVEACDAVTFWGFTDLHTWIDAQFGPGLQPLLFDEYYQRKPAYGALRDALLARARIPEPGVALLLGCASVALGVRRRLRGSR